MIKFATTKAMKMIPAITLPVYRGDAEIGSRQVLSGNISRHSQHVYSKYSELGIAVSVSTSPFSFYTLSSKTASTSMPQPPTGNNSVIVRYGTDIYAISLTGRYVSKSVDNGQHWLPATDFGSNISVSSLDAIIAKKSGVDTILIGSAYYELASNVAWITLGATQTRTVDTNPGGGSPTKNATFAQPDGTALLCQDGVGGSMGRLARYNGSTWDTSVVEPVGSTSTTVFAIKSAAGTYIAASYGGVGNTGWIRRSTDFSSWSAKIDNASSSYPTALYQMQSGRILCFRRDSSNAGVRYSDDDGVTWSAGSVPASDVGNMTMPILEPSSGNLYSNTHTGNVLVSSNGASWSLDSSQPSLATGWPVARFRAVFSYP